MSTRTEVSTAADAEAELRAARRDRVFESMVDAGLDALVLSRRDSISYASGARGLWTAGTRPFGAACVLTAAERSVHVLSSWDDGVPPEIPFDHLYGVTWNPAIMGRSLRSIPGFCDARRIGVDSLSVGFERAAGRLAPDAELVPADDLVHAVRAVKLPAEIDLVRAAVSVASAAVATAVTALTGGAPRGDALTLALRAAAAQGVTIPTSAPVVAPDPSGSLVRVDFGLLVDGYEGGQGRTVAVAGTGAGAIAAAEGAQRRLLAACRPGATGRDVLAVAAGTTGWRVRGSGMGFERPVLTESLGLAAILVEGMVLSVEVEVEHAHRRDLVLVGSDATEAI
jgi:Xaa-Pro dipeptidase